MFAVASAVIMAAGRALLLVSFSLAMTFA